MILTETATLSDLRKQVKRRVKQLVSTSSPSVEDEVGVLFSNSAIADAINKSRRIIVRILPSARKWCNRRAVFTTAEDIQEYGLDYEVVKILSVQYDVTSAGVRKSSTVDAVDIKTRKMEESCLQDAFDTPSTTNPKYRIANKGIRLIVSSNGTVTTGIHIQVEYEGEPASLTASSSYSGWPDTLNDIVVDYAISIIASEDIPSLSKAAAASVQILLASERNK